MMMTEISWWHWEETEWMVKVAFRMMMGEGKRN